MNNKEKLVRLQRYLDQLTNRLSSPVPDKHKDHPVEFKHFLTNEVRLVKLKIEGMKQ